MLKFINSDKLAKEIFGRVNNPAIRNWLFSIINDVPAADVQEIKHGHWEIGYFHDRVCSCCTHPSNDLSDYSYDYCPWCGAKMDGDKNAK